MFPCRRDREFSGFALVGIGTVEYRGRDTERIGNQEAIVGNRLIVVAKDAQHSDRIDAKRPGKYSPPNLLEYYNSHCMKLEPTFVNSNACSPK